LCGQFAGDRGKGSFQEVGEEKRKEALRVEREKEVEDKQEEEIQNNSRKL
jgi:translation initiation factor IF-2